MHHRQCPEDGQCPAFHTLLTQGWSAQLASPGLKCYLLLEGGGGALSIVEGMSQVCLMVPDPLPKNHLVSLLKPLFLLFS